MKNLTPLVALSLLSLAIASTAVAAPGGGKKPSTPKKPSRIRATLAVDAALADLSTAKGSFDFEAKKHRSLKAVVKLPLTSNTLGISDAAAAAATEIHFEFSREGAVVADCILSFQAPEAGESASTWQYRLFVKTNGKKEVHGKCSPAGTPELQSADTVSAYGVVVGSRVNFMTKTP